MTQIDRQPDQQPDQQNQIERPPLATSTRDLVEVATGLAGWWGSRHPEASSVAVSDVAAPGANGVANETLLFQVDWAQDGDHHQRRCVARIESAQQLFLDSDLGEAHRVIETLQAHSDVPVPPLLGFEADSAVLGAPFFVMGRVEGVVPSDVPCYNEAGWLFDATPEQREQVWRTSLEAVVSVHQTDPAHLHFLRPGRTGATGLEQDLSYWSAAATWSADGRSLPTLEAATAWLWKHLPADPVPGFAWGDSRYANLIFDDFRCAAVLDWDMASLAGAEADLGWWLLFEHVDTVARGLDTLPGLGTPEQSLALWESLAGRSARHMDWALVFAAYRMCIAVTRAASMLTAGGILPPGSEMLTNNIGTQYLAGMLGLAPAGAAEVPLRGLETWLPR